MRSEQNYAATEVPVSAVARARVLVAEDCVDSRQAVCSLLTRAGCAATPAANGRIAVELARQHPFDLILMDMQMPELDGYGATRQLRHDGYRGPVIALTGDVRADAEQLCRDAGCDGFLAKPCEPAQLLQYLTRYLPPAEAKTDRPFRLPPRSDAQIAELAREFARELPQTAAAIVAALARGDRRDVARLAHQTRGAAGMFGLPEAAQLAWALETAILAGEDEVQLSEKVRAFGALTRRIEEGL